MAPSMSSYEIYNEGKEAVVGYCLTLMAEEYSWTTFPCIYIYM